MTKRRRDLFKDKEHLVRMAGIFAGGIAVFFVLQMLLVPDTFGRYGHYRAAAITEAGVLPVTHAGRAACGGCHQEVAEAQQAGKHAKLGCEGCHGALAQHAAKPATQKPQKLDVVRLCSNCHASNIARPEWFKQVDVQEHSGGEACDMCHQPHAPQMSDESADTAEAATPAESATAGSGEGQ